MNRHLWPIALALCVFGCAPEAPPDNSLASYFDHTGREDILAGGIRMIPIETPKASRRTTSTRSRC